MHNEPAPESRSEMLPRRELAPEVRRGIFASAVLIGIASTVIIWVLVAMASGRFPSYGWVPVVVGAIATGCALLYACWYFRGKVYFATHGIAVIATVVAIHRGGWVAPRMTYFEYEIDGRTYRSSRNDSLMAWSEGKTLAILVHPRHRDRWIRRDAVFTDQDGH